MLVGNVGGLADVGSEVEEFGDDRALTARAVNQSELVAIVSHGLEHRAAVVGEGLVGGCSTSGEDRSDVASIDDRVVRHGGAGPARQGREQVHGGQQFVAFDTGWDDPGPPYDGGHTDPAVARPPFLAAERTVAAFAGPAECTVVAGEDDDGVVDETVCLEFVHDDTGRPVDCVYRSAVWAIARPRVEGVFDVERKMHMHVREIQEEGPMGVLSDELDRTLDVAPGQHRLVGLCLDDLTVVHERERWVGDHRWQRVPGGDQLGPVFFDETRPLLDSHVVAVWQSEPPIEAVVGGEKLGLIAAVPFADDLGCVPRVLQDRRNGVLRRGKATCAAGKQDVESVEVVEPDPGRVRAGEQRTPRRRADRRPHVEREQSSALGRELIDSRRVVHLRAVAAEVAVAEIVAVDEHDVGPAGHGRRLRGVGGCDEVDELLDGGKERWFQILPGRDLAEDVFPERCRGRVHAERSDDAVFPGLALRYVGPSVDADDRRLHRLPDVDVGVASDQDVRIGDRVGDALFLGTVDEMIEQHSETAARPGAEATDTLGEIVSAVELFDDNPFDTKVGTPDLLDEFGVVDAFDPEPTGAGNPGGDIPDVDRSACGDAGGARRVRRDDESTRHSLALDRSANRTVAVGDRVVLAVAVAQHEARGRKGDERADHAGRPVLEHRATTGGDDGIVGST